MGTIMIIDGYNALNSHPEGKKFLRGALKEARAFLIEVCRKFASGRADVREIKLFFDGDDRYRDIVRSDLFPGVEVIFSSTDTCDDEMIEAARDCSSLGNVVVVSDDNYVRNRTRGYASLMRPLKLFERKRGNFSRRRSFRDKMPISKKTREDINREYGRRLGLE